MIPVVVALFVLYGILDHIERKQIAAKIAAMLKEPAELTDAATEVLLDVEDDIDRILDLVEHDRTQEAWDELVRVSERLDGIDSSPAAKPIAFVAVAE